MNNYEKAQEPQSLPQGQNLLTYLLLFLSFIALLVVLRLARSILIPFALAVFLAYILYPLVLILNRLKIPYGLAVAVVMLLVLVVFLGVGIIVVSELNSFVQELPHYQETLKNYMGGIYSTYSRMVEKFASLLPGEPLPATVPASPPTLSRIISRLFSGLLSVFSTLSDFILVFFILIFLLADARIFKKKLIKAWGEKEEARATQIVETINQGIGGYIIIRSAINLGLAITVTVLLLILDIKYAYIWGPLTGLLNFIPYLGSFLALLPPMVMALVRYDTVWPALILLITYILIQNVEGNFITPKMVGQRVNLNALAVLLSLILWGFIWGPVGMILATPLTTCFKILCDHIQPLKPVGILLGGETKRGSPGAIS